MACSAPPAEKRTHLRAGRHALTPTGDSAPRVRPGGRARACAERGDGHIALRLDRRPLGWRGRRLDIQRAAGRCAHETSVATHGSRHYVAVRFGQELAVTPIGRLRAQSPLKCQPGQPQCGSARQSQPFQARATTDPRLPATATRRRRRTASSKKMRRDSAGGLAHGQSLRCSLQPYCQPRAAHATLTPPHMRRSLRACGGVSLRSRPRPAYGLRRHRHTASTLPVAR